MNYLANGCFEDHLEWIAARAEGGGHAASSSTLGRVYYESLKNLPLAIGSLVVNNYSRFRMASRMGSPRRDPFDDSAALKHQTESYSMLAIASGCSGGIFLRL